MAVLWWAGIEAPIAAIFGSAGAGGLFMLKKQRIAMLLVAAILVGFALVPAARTAPGCWSMVVVVACAATFPPNNASNLLRVPHWTWALALILLTTSMAATTLAEPVVQALATGVGSWCAAYILAGLVGQLLMVEARLMAWGEGGMVAVTRDLLMGRITGGMLHDLAQPLNVISMASENLAYLIDQLDIEEAERQALLERTRRISSHTEGAADILTLFRGFAREAGSSRRGEERELHTVRYALERAVAATRSTLRHQIAVELEGDALDRPVPVQIGTLELLSVAALLSVFGAFVNADRDRLKGRIVLHAARSPSHVMITVQGFDPAGQPLDCMPLDNTMQWLVEQVAHEAGGSFRCLPEAQRPNQLVLHLGYSAA